MAQGTTVRDVKNYACSQILDSIEAKPISYQQIPCHIIFDVKMDFTRKAQYVARGHKTEDPTTPTYASIVSRDSVCIGFLLAALNDLDVLGADVAGAYLNAPCHEKYSQSVDWNLDQKMLVKLQSL